jgi:hypothetical protein
LAGYSGLSLNSERLNSKDLKKTNQTQFYFFVDGVVGVVEFWKLNGEVNK